MTKTFLLKTRYLATKINFVYRTVSRLDTLVGWDDGQNTYATVEFSILYTSNSRCSWGILITIISGKSSWPQFSQLWFNFEKQSIEIASDMRMIGLCYLDLSQSTLGYFLNQLSTFWAFAKLSSLFDAYGQLHAPNQVHLSFFFSRFVYGDYSPRLFGGPRLRGTGFFMLKSFVISPLTLLCKLIKMSVILMDVGNKK